MKIEQVTELKDLDSILRIQKLAFHSVGIAHNDTKLPPLIQTTEEIQKEFKDGMVFLKCSDQNRIVGSVRAYLDAENDCHVGRLVVHPDFQQSGIGMRLMMAIEQQFADCRSFKIFTGKKTLYVMNFYERLGYKTTHDQDMGNYIMIFMTKKNKE